MWIPTWIVVSISLFVLIVNYSEAKLGLVQILTDLGLM